ncbi:cag pathogenicity island type IV secretion system protein CagD [Helicobacter pylori]|uniref:cag pathogenicity island type IV secretion system protein CagD n=1 Tax=Helicobacter pylori TaxID=210 RepID=UPI001E523264|nr:cag pathogenicity island type IV secretion system protein CagD [Helicobacter pylori]
MINNNSNKKLRGFFLKVLLSVVVFSSYGLANDDNQAKKEVLEKEKNTPSGRVYTNLDFDSFKATIKNLKDKKVTFKEVNPDIIKDEVFDFVIVNRVLKKIKDLKHYDPIIEKIFDEKGKEMGLNVELQINPEVKDFFTFKSISTTNKQRCFLSLRGETREILCDDKLYNVLLAVFNSYDPNDLLKHISTIESLKKIFYTITCEAVYL